MPEIQSQDNIFLEDILNIKNTVPMEATPILNNLKLCLANFSNFDLTPQRYLIFFQIISQAILAM